MKKCDFLKTLEWPDFETLWGDQGHNDVKHGINGSSCTFFFSGGRLRPVVVLIVIHNILSPGFVGNVNIYFDPQYQVLWRATGVPLATAWKALKRKPGLKMAPGFHQHLFLV